MADSDTRSEMSNISRAETGATRGWLVRFQRDGEKHARFFNDATQGGTDAALAKAQTWRDEQRRKLGPVRRADPSWMHTRAARRKNRQAVSQTGVTGISVQVREFSAQRVPYVTAYWVDADDRRRQTSFSVGRHGVEHALRLAAHARAETANWHGAEPMTADEVVEAAGPAVRALVMPHLPLEDRIEILSGGAGGAP